MGSISEGTSSVVTKEAKCPLCGKVVASKAALARHRRDVHSTADISSEASAGSSSAGSAHAGIGGGNSGGTGGGQDASVARVACEKCGRTFKNKSNLKIHMLTHSGLKPFG